jgi:excinuclease ABC subunit A
MQVDRYKIHDIEIVIDRLKVDIQSKHRLIESVQSALKQGNDQMLILKHDDLGNDHAKAILLSKQLMCQDTGLSPMMNLRPMLFHLIRLMVHVHNAKDLVLCFK